MSAWVAALALGASLQKAPTNGSIYPDVPDNHYVYAMLIDLRAHGLLPELHQDTLTRGDRPLTRGMIGMFVVEATFNTRMFVDAHRHADTSHGIVQYSSPVSDLTGDQLKYLDSLVPRLRSVAKTFAANLPSFVKSNDLDRSLEDQANVIDGLTAID